MSEDILLSPVLGVLDAFNVLGSLDAAPVDAVLTDEVRGGAGGCESLGSTTCPVAGAANFALEQSLRRVPQHYVIDDSSLASVEIAF